MTSLYCILERIHPSHCRIKTGFSRETAHGLGGLIDIWIETNESMELLLLDFSVQPVSVLFTAVMYPRVFSLFQYCLLL